MAGPLNQASGVRQASHARTGHAAGLDGFERIYLHVGLHRTGSTYLQKVILPKLAVHRMIKPDVKYLWEAASFDPRSFREILGRQLTAPGNGRLVISQETLSGRPEINPPLWRELLVERLHATFPESRIVLVLRNQWDYLESVYAYRVMSRGVEYRSFNAYLSEKLAEGLAPTLEYDRLIDDYHRHFGVENVLVLLHEQLSTDPNGFVARLCGFLGIPRIEADTSRRINVTSRSSAMLAVHRALNYPVWMLSEGIGKLPNSNHRHVWNTRRYYCRLKDRTLGSLVRFMPRSQARGKLYVEESMRLKIDAMIGSSNQRLAGLLGEDLAGLGYHLAS